MGKSGADPSGVLFLLDDADTIVAKVRRAVTDDDPSLTTDDPARPGVTNLAVVLGAVTGRSAEQAVAGLHGAAALKAAVTDAVVDLLEPLQRRHRELAADPDAVTAELAADVGAVSDEASATLDAARGAMGLLAREDR